MSWTKVVQKVLSSPRTEGKLQYFPPHAFDNAGIPTIRPPKEFLVENQKEWNTSLVGYFLGSNLPFKMVEEEAKCLWLHLGFLKMYMVKKGFYVFKFNSEIDRSRILAGGPWHFKRNQIFLQPWFEGKKLEKTGFEKLPIWLEPLPYARILVEANVKSMLPPVVEIAVLDSDGNTESIRQARVEYFNKPAQCSSCMIFGHSLAKCPVSTSSGDQKSHVPQETGPPLQTSVPTTNTKELKTKNGGGTSPGLKAIEVIHAHASVGNVLDNNGSSGTISVNTALVDKGGRDTMDLDLETASPPIPTSGILTKLKQVDEVAKLKGILKPSSSGLGLKKKVDADGFQTVQHKNHKKKKGQSPSSPLSNLYSYG
ncbi:hypothetical protein POM88_049582 [Heracleum sosnowskyi]|uniref:DUF4283 domain-containing protein n=1 Tax=Heracleum sosnowskyi TaxID=360622 RepID=A0AAD8M0P1_9APIA|nr:hypothetical protein POM88_049582 [Heracleum sosnowskyi]